MLLRLACALLALGLAACQRQPTTSAGQDGARLEAPAPETEPSRVFAPANELARNATGELTVSMTMRLADQTGGGAQEVLTLRAAKGLVVEAQISGAISPATQVSGQTLRALLALPVEEPQVLFYQVQNETHPEGVAGLCGAERAAYLVFWEPSSPGETGLKIMGVLGAAPGAANARPCAMLEFARS